VLPRTIVLWLAVAAAGALGAAAVAFDRGNSVDVARAFVAPHRSWIDDARLGRVTLVLGPNAGKTSVAEQLFWNRSLDRLALLPGATSPDRFPAAPLAPARDGSLGVRGAVLLDGYGSTVRLAGAQTIATHGTWTLLRPRDTARLAYQVTGRYADGWLAPAGRIGVWSHTGTLRLVLTAPAGASAMTITFRWRGHTQRVDLAPGRSQRVAIPVASLPFAATYSASSLGYLGSRPVSVRAAVPTLDARPGGR